MAHLLQGLLARPPVCLQLLLQLRDPGLQLRRLRRELLHLTPWNGKDSQVVPLVAGKDHMPPNK